MARMAQGRATLPKRVGRAELARAAFLLYTSRYLNYLHCLTLLGHEKRNSLFTSSICPFSTIVQVASHGSPPTCLRIVAPSTTRDTRISSNRAPIVITNHRLASVPLPAEHAIPPRASPAWSNYLSPPNGLSTHVQPRSPYLTPVKRAESETCPARSASQAQRATAYAPLSIFRNVTYMRSMVYQQATYVSPSWPFSPIASSSSSSLLALPAWPSISPFCYLACGSLVPPHPPTHHTTAPPTQPPTNPCPITMCDYTQVQYKCTHVRYVVKAWCTKYQQTHVRCPANVTAV